MTSWTTEPRGWYGWLKRPAELFLSQAFLFLHAGDSYCKRSTSAAFFFFNRVGHFSNFGINILLAFGKKTQQEKLFWPLIFLFSPSVVGTRWASNHYYGKLMYKNTIISLEMFPILTYLHWLKYRTPLKHNTFKHISLKFSVTPIFDEVSKALFLHSKCSDEVWKHTWPRAMREYHYAWYKHRLGLTMIWSDDLGVKGHMSMSLWPQQSVKERIERKKN